MDFSTPPWSCQAQWLSLKLPFYKTIFLWGFVVKKFLILPTQLFDKKHLPGKQYSYVLWEHPHYFLNYNYNKKKLVLHRASLKAYEDYLSKAGYSVAYYTYKQKPLGKDFTMFESSDNLLIKDIDCILSNPNFLLSSDDFKAYREKTDKFFFNAFYMWGKKRIDLLPGIKSQDKNNRQKMPQGLDIPSLPGLSKEDEKFIKPAQLYVEKEFKNNHGSVKDFCFPVTHKTTKKWLLQFITKKFKNFGPYQDYIDKDKLFLFHSCLSANINIGLLNPLDIIKVITDPAIEKKIPLNSFEGYVRQLFWREYQLYCYRYYDFKKDNYFGNTKRLTKKWYEGTLGVPPVDDAIVQGFSTGYLHHIQRLMVVGNFMNLYGISPDQGYKWFMEFSCDSYDWVMHQNVYDMVFFVSGGKTMRRPYVSSSNYILKMSNYTKGSWCAEWDDRYRGFLKNHRNKLLKFRYYFRGL